MFKNLSILQCYSTNSKITRFLNTAHEKRGVKLKKKQVKQIRLNFNVPEFLNYYFYINIGLYFECYCTALAIFTYIHIFYDNKIGIRYAY